MCSFQRIKKYTAAWTILVLLSFFAIIRLVIYFCNNVPTLYMLLDLDGGHIGLYPYFVAGWIYRRFNILRRLLENKWMCFFSSLLVMFSIVHPFRLYFFFHSYGLYPYIAIVLFLNISILILQQTRSKIILNYFGKRTLDIYVLHVFFATCIPPIGDLFTEVARYGVSSSMSIQFFVSFPATMLIIWICLNLGNLLRRNELLALFCFGDLKLFNCK